MLTKYEKALPKLSLKNNVTKYLNDFVPSRVSRFVPYRFWTTLLLWYTLSPGTIGQCIIIIIINNQPTDKVQRPVGWNTMKTELSSSTCRLWSIWDLVVQIWPGFFRIQCVCQKCVDTRGRIKGELWQPLQRAVHTSAENIFQNEVYKNLN